MKEFVKKSAVMQMLHEAYSDGVISTKDGCRALYKRLNDMPVADVNLYECIIDSEGYESCSHCNEHETGMRYFSFCPRCGVKLKH